MPSKFMVTLELGLLINATEHQSGRAWRDSGSISNHQLHIPHSGIRLEYRDKSTDS
jgi:hypothetical protein